MRVYVGDTLPPDFTFHAGLFAECCTYFSSLIVFEEGSEQPLWKIAAQRTNVDRSEANSLVIHYGKTPDRFAQETPASGQPPPLMEGKTYLVVAGATGYVPWAHVRFTIKDGRVVRLPVKRGSLPG